MELVAPSGARTPPKRIALVFSGHYATDAARARFVLYGRALIFQSRPPERDAPTDRGAETAAYQRAEAVRGTRALDHRDPTVRREGVVVSWVQVPPGRGGWPTSYGSPRPEAIEAVMEVTTCPKPLMERAAIRRLRGQAGRNASER